MNFPLCSSPPTVLPGFTSHIPSRSEKVLLSHIFLGVGLVKLTYHACMNYYNNLPELIVMFRIIKFTTFCTGVASLQQVSVRSTEIPYTGGTCNRMLPPYHS